MSHDHDKEQEKVREEVEASLVRHCGNLFLVFEYVEHDLGGLIDARYKFTPLEIKVIMKQLFEVLDHLHELKVLHRDIKSSNLLLTNRHQLKLADFGLARSFINPIECFGIFGPKENAQHELTNNVVTMWYRPIELLLGSRVYGYAVDMWSAGCVMAELELGKPLFPGKSEVEQTELICKTLGTPSKEIWPSMIKLPNHTWISSMPRYSSTLRSSLSGCCQISEQSMALLERMLVYDPEKRSTARMALNNMYFLSAPVPPDDPTKLDPLGTFPTTEYNIPHSSIRRFTRCLLS